MSSVIAVSVSLLGLLMALFTCIIFIQMILSFPAMLSSNSQAYVQQQRKLHHIPSGNDALLQDTAASSWDEHVVDDSWEDEEELTRGRTLRRQSSRLDGALGCRRRVNRL